MMEIIFIFIFCLFMIFIYSVIQESRYLREQANIIIWLHKYKMVIRTSPSMFTHLVLVKLNDDLYIENCKGLSPAKMYSELRKIKKLEKIMNIESQLNELLLKSQTKKEEEPKKPSFWD